MKFKLTLAICALILSPALLFASDEALTITTYYPSPMGSYHELSTNYLDYGTTLASPPVAGNNCSKEGQTAYNNTAKKVYLCDGSKWKDFGVGGAFRVFTVSPADTAALNIHTLAYVYLPGLSIDEQFPGGYVSIDFVANYRLRAVYAILQLLVDGTVQDWMLLNSQASGGTNVVLRYVGNLSAGRHVIKVQGGGVTGGAIGTIDAFVESGQPRLTVIY